MSLEETFLSFCNSQLIYWHWQVNWTPFTLSLQIGGEFDYFKSGLKVGCFYGGVPVGPQGKWHGS